MSDENVTENSKREVRYLMPGEVARPVCPYCGVDPLSFRTGLTKTGDGQVVFYAMCANRDCRKLLPLCMVGMDQPRIIPAGGAVLRAN